MQNNSTNFLGRAIIALLLYVGFSEVVFAFKLLNEKSRKIIEDAKNAPLRWRIEAIKICGHKQIHPCFFTLAENLKEKDIDIRNHSTRSIAFLRLREGIPYLKEAIETIRTEIKDAEKTAIEMERKFQKVELLEQEKKITKLYITQSNMIWTIGIMRDRSESAYLLSFLKDENPRIRSSAALAVSFLGDDKAKTALDTALKAEKDETVTIELLRALLVLAPSNADHTIRVLDLLASTRPVIRKTAAEVIIQFHIREARRYLERALLIENDREARKKLLNAYQFLVYH